MNRECICVTVPHHVTAFFIPKYTGSPETTGSYGAGIVVGPEALVCAGAGEHPHWEPLRSVLLTLNAEDTKVLVKDPLEPGTGYASSAASAIGGALAIASLKGLPVSKALLVAHVAEVRASTGLGDVQAIASNPIGEGIVIRLEPGPPHLGRVEVIPLPSSVSIISVELGRMRTSNLLKSYDSETAKASFIAFKKLLSNPTFDEFVSIATNYTEELVLKGKASIDRRLISVIKGTPGLMGYYLKKKLVIVLLESDRIRDAVEYLLKEKLKVVLLQRKTTGIKVVERRCHTF